jgi:hypothetical protein
MKTAIGRVGMNDRGEGTGSLRIYAGALVLGMILTGCAGGPSQEDPSWTFVPITDINMVAGEWGGMVKKNGGVIPDGNIQLTINANGTYKFVGQRLDDVALGSGFLETRDGRLSGDTERRIATLALYDHKGKAVLVVDSTARQTGDEYHGVLMRTKP